MRYLQFIMPVFIFGTTIIGYSQENLVPNPSFEEYNRLPTSPGDAKETLKEWKIPNEQGGGDYYHVDSPAKHCGIKDNYFGSEDPHSGKAYAGFCVTPQYREFLACALKTPLVKGKQYKVSFFISHGDKASVSYIKEIGVLFLKRERILPFGIPMSVPPQIVFYQDTGFTFHNGWQELTAIYTADGTEQWMYIGAHEWQCDTCKSVPGTPRTENPYIFGGLLMKEAHYYVDDVSVTEVIPGEIAMPPADTTEKTFITGLVYSYSNILFATNSAALDERAAPVLDPIIAHLNAHPQLTVGISGHTDSVGTDADNYRLSLARADAVKKYLTGHGVAPERITTTGYGESWPLVPNDTEKNRAQNRRVDFVFADPSKK